MSSEKVTVEQAVQKLSEANNTNSTRLMELEKKMTEINHDIIEQNKAASDNISSGIMSKLEQNQQQWNHLTADVRDLKTEIRKICEAIAMNQITKIDDNQPVENKTCTPRTDHSASTIDESFDHTRPVQHNTSQPPYTIVIPPTSSIPTFHGKISENPHQFLIRVKEYAETVNHWNEQSLLSGLSQFLQDTALEWYCQLRTSHRRPQTWTEFVAVFLNQFNSPIRRAQLEQLWKNCKQGENETINEFMVRLRALWRERKPNETEDDLIRHLMCKMRNNLLTVIGVSRYETLDEIIFEAQKVEEILYQRSKQQKQYNNGNQESSHYNTTSTPLYDVDEQCVVQAMSAQQTKQRFNAYMKKPRYTNYSSQSMTSRQDPQPTYNPKCYMCGLKGHIQKNCPNQYNTYQQQYPERYSKNDNGAQAGRDRRAPM